MHPGSGQSIIPGTAQRDFGVSSAVKAPSTSASSRGTRRVRIPLFADSRRRFSLQRCAPQSNLLICGAERTTQQLHCFCFTGCFTERMLHWLESYTNTFTGRRSPDLQLLAPRLLG